MDERRRQNVAYEYLCHLEEAKRWMEACLNEELPPTTELEEGLRNGVHLAKLGNFFSPKVVSLKKIYDREQTRYKATGLHFRHTDNVIQWLNAMAEIGLPKNPGFLGLSPWTSGSSPLDPLPILLLGRHRRTCPKGTPNWEDSADPGPAIQMGMAGRVCLYLFKLGLAPQIQDLYGKVDFTEEEISNMRSELEKYGIQMPAFGKIGGILANELSLDEAALHAAVIAINEAIDHQIPTETFLAMKNPNAMLVNLDETLALIYQSTLHQAKQDKAGNARKRVASEDAGRERDVYEELLTQAEIQGNVNQVNTRSALANIDLALDQGDASVLYRVLSSAALGLRALHPENSDWYFKQLLREKQEKQKDGRDGPLQKEELQAGINQANAAAKQYHQSKFFRLSSALRKPHLEQG
ncbi:Ras GTPase-activating-like protein IQGAP3, partial [Ophiophagus hannah]